MAETNAPTKAAPRKAVAKPSTVEPTVDRPQSMAEALAQLQRRLPDITKEATAIVKDRETRQEMYRYKYSNLADISRLLLPVLGELGLSFVAKPTWVDTEGGREFVLAYKLLHVSGESETGEYPLPANATPQALGGAITYARRYCLCAVTGVAPDDADDDAAAAQAEARGRSSGPVTDAQAYSEIAVGVTLAATSDRLRTWWDLLVTLGNEDRVTESDARVMRERIITRLDELSDVPVFVNTEHGVTVVPVGDGGAGSSDSDSSPGSGATGAESGGSGTQVTPHAQTADSDAHSGVAQGRDLPSGVDEHTTDVPLPDEPPTEEESGATEAAVEHLAAAGLDPQTMAGEARVELLQRFVDHAQSTDTLKSQYGMVAAAWPDYTRAEQTQITAMFNAAYERITGNKRPKLLTEWE